MLSKHAPLREIPGNIFLGNMEICSLNVKYLITLVSLLRSSLKICQWTRLYELFYHRNLSSINYFEKKVVTRKCVLTWLADPIPGRHGFEPHPSHGFFSIFPFFIYDKNSTI